jgi:Autophagy protein Atg8 ubiquitin like
VKWLVPEEMSVMQLSAVLKQRLRVSPGKEFYLLVDGK